LARRGKGRRWGEALSADSLLNNQTEANI